MPTMVLAPFPAAPPPLARFRAAAVATVARKAAMVAAVAAQPTMGAALRASRKTATPKPALVETAAVPVPPNGPARAPSPLLSGLLDSFCCKGLGCPRIVPSCSLLLGVTRGL